MSSAAPTGALAVAVALTLAAAAGAVVSTALLALLARAARRAGTLERSLHTRTRRPLRLLLPLLAAQVELSGLPATARSAGPAGHVLTLLTIAALAWLLVSLTYVVDDVAVPRLTGVGADNLRARRAMTQVQVFRRVAVVAVVLVAVSVALLTFRSVRALGASLLASAGIIGLVAGIAARPLTTNLISGFQIAITQPIRLDDVVVVEGEWGRVEEIALTYVVVRIWDRRCLVLPIVYFTENAFQNWTRTGADLLAHTHLYLDFRAPVAALREQLLRVLQGSPLWDGQVWALQVTAAEATTVQVRVLAGVRSSADSWDLRCLVREQLLAWLVAEHPEALPRLRGEAAPAPP